MSIAALILFFGFIYPVGMLVVCFKLAKRHGILWYYYAAVMAITVLEYIFVPHFSSIMPNIIVTTLLCLIFGCGIGGCFSDKTLIEAEKQNRRMKKLHEDKPYTKILNTDHSGKKKNHKDV